MTTNKYVKIVIYSVLTLVFTLGIVDSYGHTVYYAFFYSWNNSNYILHKMLPPPWYHIATLSEIEMILIIVSVILGLGICNSLYFTRHKDSKRRISIAFIVLLYIIILLFNIFLAYKRIQLQYDYVLFCIASESSYSLKIAINGIDFWIIVCSLTLYYSLWHISFINLLKNINQMRNKKIEK